MSLCAELTKLRRKETFDTNPDPDPEWRAEHSSPCDTSDDISIPGIKAPTSY